MDQDSQTAAIAALCALAGGTLGGLFSGFYQHMRDLLNKPKLEIDLDDSDSGIVQAEWEEGNQLIQRVLVRPYLINNGKRTAVNCRVYIIGISEVLGSKVTPTKYKDSMQIPWPGWQFTPKDIPQSIRSYVDLIRVRKDRADGILLLSVVQPLYRKSRRFQQRYPSNTSRSSVFITRLATSWFQFEESENKFCKRFARAFGHCGTFGTLSAI